MSSRIRKAHAKPLPPVTGEDVREIDSFEPDYGVTCEVYGESPCVTGIRDGCLVYRSHMCGPHTFGTAYALDPAFW
ncbi:hypothetical protein VSR82_25205 [Burkholderia sp. JPY481]